MRRTPTATTSTDRPRRPAPARVVAALAAAFALLAPATLGMGAASAKTLDATGAPAAHVAASVGDVDGTTFDLTVRADGTVHVDQTLDLTYDAGSRSPSVYWDVPTRLPWPLTSMMDSADSSGSDDSAGSDDGAADDGSADDQAWADQRGTVITVSDATVTMVAGGHPVPLDPARTLPSGRFTLISAYASDTTDADITQASVHLTYDLHGAVLETEDGPVLAAGIVDSAGIEDDSSISVKASDPSGTLDLGCFPTNSLADQEETACTRHDDGTSTTTAGDYGLAVTAPVDGVHGAKPTLVALHGDTIERFAADYAVQADGSVDVTETIDARPENAQYLSRTFVTAEPWSTWKDRRYGVTLLDSTAPSGHPPRVSQSSQTDDRTSDLEVDYDDPATTHGTGPARYVLHYRLTGLFTRDGGSSTFRQDVLGNLGSDLVEVADVTVTFPKGAASARCHVPVRYSDDDVAPGGTPCSSDGDGATVGGKLTFHAKDVDGDHTIVLTTSTPQTLGAAAGPDLSWRLPPALSGYLAALAVGGVVMFVVCLLIALIGRLVRLDARPSGKVADPTTPPDVPVMVGGLLHDGVVDDREVAAVLVRMAAGGLIAFREGTGSGMTVRVLHPDGGRDPYERAALAVFVDAAGETTRKLGRKVGPGALLVLLPDVRSRLLSELRTEVTGRQHDGDAALFRRRAKIRTAKNGSWWRTLWALPFPGVFPIAVTVRGVHGLGPNGRSRRGRDIADHVSAYRETLRRDGRAPTVAPKGGTATGMTRGAPSIEYHDGGAVPGLLDSSRPLSDSLTSSGENRGYANSTGYDDSIGYANSGGYDDAWAASWSTAPSLAAPAPTYPTGGAAPDARDDVFGAQLPWAIALGVEPEWRARIAPLVDGGALEVPEGLPWDTRDGGLLAELTRLIRRQAPAR